MAGMFLGIDIGTGGVRACIVDSEGDIKGMASAALPPPRQDGDAIDQDPELWWQATVAAVLKLGRTVSLDHVERIAVDGTSGTLLLIDADGVPCSPGLMYNDARAASEAARIKEVAPAESGAHGRSSALAKLLHLLHQGNINGARHAVHQADWIAGRLGACHGMELPFVFKTLDKTTGPQGLTGAAPVPPIDHQIHAIWAEFATRGTLPWAQFNEADRLVYQLEKGEVIREDIMPAARHLPE